MIYYDFIQRIKNIPDVSIKFQDGTTISIRKWEEILKHNKVLYEEMKDCDISLYFA